VQLLVRPCAALGELKVARIHAIRLILFLGCGVVAASLGRPCLALGQVKDPPRTLHQCLRA
jgi:hypothetical protein